MRQRGSGGSPAQSRKAPTSYPKPETMSSKKEAEVVVAEVVATETAPQTTAIATPAARGSLTAFVSEDIEIPRLNVLQKMSTIEGPTGSVTIDKEAVLLQAEQKVPVIVVGASKRWKEDIPYDDDKIPRFANTKEEADRIAAESQYEIVEFAELVVLIPQVEGVDEELFPYPIGDTNYQLGRFTVQKDAYRLTYKRLFTFQTFNPNLPVASRMWLFGTELMSKGKYTWYVPTLSVTKQETPAEVLAFVANVNGGAA